MNQMSAEERGHFEPIVTEAIELELHRDASAISELLSDSTGIDFEQISKELGGNLAMLQDVDPFWQELILADTDASTKLALVERLQLQRMVSVAPKALPPALGRAVRESVFGGNDGI